MFMMIKLLLLLLISNSPPTHCLCFELLLCARVCASVGCLWLCVGWKTSYNSFILLSLILILIILGRKLTQKHMHKTQINTFTYQHLYLHMSTHTHSNTLIHNETCFWLLLYLIFCCFCNGRQVVLKRMYERRYTHTFICIDVFLWCESVCVFFLKIWKFFLWKFQNFQLVFSTLSLTVMLLLLVANNFVITFEFCKALLHDFKRFFRHTFKTVFKPYARIKFLFRNEPVSLVSIHLQVCMHINECSCVWIVISISESVLPARLTASQSS